MFRRLHAYLYAKLCKCKTQQINEGLEEPQLYFCENKETNNIIETMHNIWSYILV